MMKASAMTGTALGWIREDLDKQLNKLRLQVENIARNPMAGETALETANDDVVMLKLTFETLVLTGVVQILAEMIELLEQLKEAGRDERRAALDVLMDALVVIPAYLDRLQAGHQDLPVVLLPIINRLREARGAGELSEGTLFAPLLDVELPELEFVRRPGYDEPFDYFSRRMERQYESALLSWQQDQQDLSLLSALQGICETMRHRLKRYDLKRLWWVATEVVGGLMDGHAANDVNLRRLMARLHLLLQNIAEGGENAVDSTTTTSITQALLFHVAKARPGGAALDLVRERFELTRLMPDREALMRAHGTLSGRDREMYESLSVAVQDELALIKDALDLELRTGRVEPERRAQSVEALHRLSDTLRILGLTGAADAIENQLALFTGSSQGSREEREAVLVRLAERLVIVESDLNEQIETLGEPLDGEAGESFIDLPRHEQNRIRVCLLDEAVISLHDSEDAVRKRFSGDDHADPGRALDEVTGALDLIDEREAARLCGELRDVLREKLHRVYAETGIPAEDLESLTDAMAALELFLAARRDQQRDSKRFIDILRDRLARLAGPADNVIEMGLGLAADPAQDGGAEPAAKAPAATTAAADLSGEGSQEEAAEGRPAPDVPAPLQAGDGGPDAADSGSTDALPSMIDPELRDIFLEEYEEVLEALQLSIPEWMAALDNVDALTRIRRAFHTLKGSGRMVGAEELGDFAWQVEDMLNGLLEGRVVNFADISAMVRLAQATLPALRQRLMQQPAGVSGELIRHIGAVAQGLGQGQPANWDGLSELLPAYLAGMLPGAIKPEMAAGKPFSSGDESEDLLREELKQNLEPIQQVLEQVSRDRGTRVAQEHVLAMHTIAGALSMQPEGRDAEIAKGLEAVLLAQSKSGRRFADDAVWTMVSAVGHIQARIDRLEGQTEAEAPADQDELVEQLGLMAEQLDGPEVEAPLAMDEDEAGLAAMLAAEAELDGAPGDAQPPPAEESLDPEITAIFLEEAGEVLERSDTLLNDWRDDLDKLGLVRKLQREIHTFKGGARMSGLTALGDYSHDMENLLERIAGQQMIPSIEAVQVLEEACDRLQSWVEVVAGGRMPDAGPARVELQAQIQALEAGPVLVPAAPAGVTEDPGLEQALQELEAEPPGEKTVQEIPAAPEAPAEPETPPRADTDGKAEAVQIRVASELLDRMVNAAGEVSIFRSRLDQEVGQLRTNMGEFEETMTRLREQFRKLDIEIETQIRSNYQASPAAKDGTFDPLELDEFSTLHQLSRGLSETVSDLLNLQEMVEENARRSEQLLSQQSRVSTELQEGLMKTRMVPFGSIAARLRRLVRGAAKETRKKARLELRMVGGSDDLDRNVLERITAPLEHMIRNAIVHGIEKPKARTANGKEAEGEITVTVESEATEFVIRIEDDGAGIDLDAIRAQAVERGLLQDGDEPSRQQLYEFMMDSGFTTSSEVTRLAGRGVGMDVVSSEIKQIGGSLEIDSEAGRGTRFVIRIPFTLAVMQAIGVMAGKNRYLLPLSSVVGVSRMLPAEYEALLAEESPVYSFAGQDYPVLDLEAVLGEPARPLGRDTVSLLILSAGDQKAAFRVPDLLPHREVVIKPVGPQVSCVPCILGGSISANGEVVVILDPGPMIRHALMHGVRPEAPAPEALSLPSNRLALVVDDSITMRKVTSRVLEGHDFDVLTARDGVDALEQLRDRTPDIMLFDIEMPRMDGYELTENVREDVRLRDVPIIMITSRAGQKHRDRAEQAGANAYLTKPYSESELIDEVSRLLTVAED